MMPLAVAAGLALACLAILLAGTAVTYAQTSGTGSAPGTPETPQGKILWMSMVDIYWNEVSGADSYELQYFSPSGWIEVPARDGDHEISVTFYGTGAVVRGQRHSWFNIFRVRAVNSHGSSGWSDWVTLPQTQGQGAWEDVPEPANVPATGGPRYTPKYRGTGYSSSMAEGEAPTADTSGIEDENGLEGVKFNYQWIRSDGTTDTDIDGATGRTYTITAGDAGKAIKLRVSFTDRHGFAESLTYDPAANVAATGVPVIQGTLEVLRMLTADTSSIADENGLDDVEFSYQWIRSDGGSDSDIEGATSSTYTLQPEDRGKDIKVRVSFTDNVGHEETLTSEGKAVSVSSERLGRTCLNTPYQPTATEVDVDALPIVVESTTADYFVLYASLEVDGTAIESPVLVKRGETGTTTLAENVASLPIGSYRVEKYLVSDPADVDRDCVDDIAELDDVAGKNPVNPAPSIDISNGTVVIPDRETFESLSYQGGPVGGDGHLIGLETVKFFIYEWKTDRPVVYFMNTENHRWHHQFENAIGIRRRSADFEGHMVYHPNVIAPDGSLGVYRFEASHREGSRFLEVAKLYTALAASMPLLDDNLAYYPLGNLHRSHYQAERALYDASRVNVLLDGDIFPDVDFMGLNQGEGYGYLRAMDLEERPNPRDVVVYETLPNDLPRVAGIITAAPQTQLSHVNLRAIQDGVPNAFIRDPLDQDDVDDLIGSHVYYRVTAEGYTLRAATLAEVNAHHAASRPATAQTPERDLSVTTITPLSQVGFDDWDSFGVKAANVAVLGTLDFPDGTVPDGFAVPFYFYDEFMKHNDLYDDVREMLADTDFQTDYDTMADELKELRKKIKKAETPEWIVTALTTMHATYSEGQSLRYRSSTNNEDLPGFNGAGLYDSKTQHPEETEEDGISKSLKQVYASLWNFRAFIERDFHRIDHLTSAMGVLVHPNYEDELVNGVAVSVDPTSGIEGAYYVNSQVGEDMVTNPEANSMPEELLLHANGSHTVTALSNQASPGQLLMTAEQMGQLRRHLAAIHDEFEELYGTRDGERFAMEIEFKITSGSVLAIKQARPWSFSRSDADSSEGPLLGFTLVDATDQSDVAELTMGSRVILNDPANGSYGIRVDVAADAAIGSVRLELTGAKTASRTENGKPYSLYGDSDSNVHGQALPVGSYRLHATAFSGSGLAGDGLQVLEVLFSIAEPNTVSTGAPGITGIVQVGETLSADTSGIADEDGLDNAAYSYQWVRNDGTTDSGIQDATGSTYTLTADDLGKTIRVRVSFTDDAGNGESLTSAATETVAARSNTPATGAPAITGILQVGETLTADTSGIADEDGLEDVTFSYQWLADSADIPGATGSSHTLAGSEAGQAIRVRVTFTDDAGNAESLTSEATAAVAAAPVPLTASFSGVQGNHGNAEFSFRLTFSESFSVSHATIKAALLVTNGETVTAKRVNRSGDDRNKAWNITVRPTSGETTSVILPVTTDCGNANALCTADGRKLSNSPLATVAE